VIKALSLDLDDTLWPIWPVIERAETELHRWFEQHAPATAAMFSMGELVRLRDGIAHEFPDRAHDFTWMRRLAIERALVAAGDDPALAAPAFDCFFHWRQQVVLFDDAKPALQRLAAKFPLIGLTNGNADWRAIGLAPYFSHGVLAAREFGQGKPHAAFFHEACRQLGCAPAEVLHVGDDWPLDVEGAQGAGLPVAWVRRAHHADKPAGGRADHELTDLLQLADLLGA
jgi:FMN hydrolase / 5-amino-6-(5-phospho-D-ribitylamino)uracil phosphatase